ncbi:siroheme synthase CysG [Porticoccaceae bacterium LTM1]|nr:siroheme synthase CysG [Porticoccaceae bacterium LTM1]
MKYFPIFADLKDKPVLVVGAGTVAQRKIHLLLKTGAQLKVVAREVGAPVAELHSQGRLELRKGEFLASDLDGQWLVIAATNDVEVNQRIEAAASERQVFANVVDDRHLSQFIVPAIVDRDSVQVAISTSGDAPVLARSLRAELESRLPSRLGQLAAKMGKWRSVVKQKLQTSGQRRLFWEQLLNSSIPSLVYQGQDAQAESEVLRLLNSEKPSLAGHVSLVGAGPGDPELLTLKALQRIQTADVVFYDNLVSDDVLELIRRDADRIYVGKKSGAHSSHQEDIQQQLVSYAQQGLRVVRLKGGDPFVFGRGGEELGALKDAGISFDVVPGITAAAASAAYSGIPLTHRDYSQSAILVTGHGKDGGELDWKALAKSNQTLAVYMGLKQAATISGQLISHGRDPKTPVALIERATTSHQRTVSGQLDQLPEMITRHQLESPTMILIGEVCQLAGQYQWFNDSYQQYSPAAEKTEAFEIPQMCAW